MAVSSAVQLRPAILHEILAISQPARWQEIKPIGSLLCIGVSSFSKIPVERLNNTFSYPVKLSSVHSLLSLCTFNISYLNFFVNRKYEKISKKIMNIPHFLYKVYKKSDKPSLIALKISWLLREEQGYHRQPSAPLRPLQSLR